MNQKLFEILLILTESLKFQEMPLQDYVFFHGHLNKKILYIILMKQEITFEDYTKVEIKVGTVLSVLKKMKKQENLH